MSNEPARIYKDSGWIEVICGCMFSGKTEELIRRLKRATLAQQSVLVFKPSVENRYHPSHVVSHNQEVVQAISVSRAREILQLVQNQEVIGIDEAQFFDEEIVEVCNLLANKGKRVIVVGLDMDYTGKPFGSMPQLLAIAEFVTKLHAICAVSGELANYSQRITPGKELVELGSDQQYKPLSRKLFYELDK